MDFRISVLACLGALLGVVVVLEGCCEASWLNNIIRGFLAK